MSRRWISTGDYKMGLFKQDYAERIRMLIARSEDLELTEDDLIQNFSADSKILERIDIEFIHLLMNLAKERHISEKLKNELLHILSLILERLKLINFENREIIKSIVGQIEIILIELMTVERIGIEYKGMLFIGTFISGHRQFSTSFYKSKIPDVGGIPTLGFGLYCTDNYKMAINYAFLRYNEADSNLVRARFGENFKPTVYTVKLKQDKSHIADLNDQFKIRAICKDLRNFLNEKNRINLAPQKEIAPHFSQYLEYLIRNQIAFDDIRKLASHNEYSKNFALSRHFSCMLIIVADFLKSLGYNGLRSKEGGEKEKSVYPWESSSSYLIFNPDDVEVIEEENFRLEDNQAVRTG